MDRDLVERARSGDQEAFADLVHQVSDTLFGVARRILRDPGLAEDVLQNALVTIWRKLPHLREPDRFEGWAYRILVHACYAEAPRNRRWTATVRVLPVALPRASGIAAVALVAVVGVGGLIFLGNRAAPGGTGGQPTSPPATVAPTTAPTASPTPRPTPAPTSEAIDGALEPTSEWTPFTSTVYGYTMAYPAGWEAGPASRAWQQGDDLGLPTADEFVRPDNELGYAVWQMPAGEDADIESVDGLTAWAEAFCNDNGVSGCDTLAERTVPMCLDAGGDTCRAAIRVRSEGTNPEDEAEYAFFPGWASVMLTEAPDKVTVVMTGRGDAWAGAAEYGGVVELLESILSTMGVTPR